MRSALLAALLFHGCDSTCEPLEEAFELDDSLTSKDVTVMLASWGLSSSSKLKCLLLGKNNFESNISDLRYNPYIKQPLS